MANDIAAIKNYTTILDRVYQREASSTVLNSPARIARAGRNAKEIMIPKTSVTGLGDYTRNVGYKTGSIDFSYETDSANLIFTRLTNTRPNPTDAHPPA